MPSQELKLVGTGLALGCVHVLTGPDHLSALATLSANIDNRCTAFQLGIRWGVGHSTGLLLVGGIFLVITGASIKSTDSSTSPTSSNDNDNDERIVIPDHVSNFFEGIVGIFLLLLGFYGLIRAWDKRQLYYSTTVSTTSTEHQSSIIISDGYSDTDEGHCNNNNNGNSLALLPPTKSQSTSIPSPDGIDLVLNSVNSYHNHCCPILDNHHHHHHHHVAPQPTESSTNFNNEHNNDTDNHNDHHHHHSYCCHGWISRIHDWATTVSTQTMAFCAGIVHGLAGPGGVLGVIPAIQLHNVRLATIYLSCFCFSSIITMGIFATTYGYISHTLAKTTGTPDRAFVIEFVSASLSIIVGLLWLILLYYGTLDDIFP